MSEGKVKKPRKVKASGTSKRAKAAPIKVGDRFEGSYKGQVKTATAIEKEGGGIQFRANGSNVYPSLTAAAMDIVGFTAGKTKSRISGRKFFKPLEAKSEAASA